MDQANGPTPAVALTGVSKQFAAGPRILDSLDLAIAPGEFVTLLGSSGSGKSTLLKLIAGLLTPSSGTIRVYGKAPLEARDSMSFLFQDPTLLPWRTVEANVGLACELSGIAREEQAARVRALLALVKLSHSARSYPRQLSGGMKMRVSIARALATRPQLLLMDEPFAALDEISRDHLNEELLRIYQQQQITVVFVTHSVSEAVFLSNRIVVLAPGPG
ncbi:MAG TPA: ABC transporter ATP-binding protein, partial [Acidobacteriaceae bacterium]